MLYSQRDSHVPRNNLKVNHAVLRHVPFLCGKCQALVQHSTEFKQEVWAT